MTTRTIYYANQLNNSQFFLNDELQKMLDNSMQNLAILGTGTLIFGMPCAPTSPASLAVTLGTGGIFQNVNIDNTQFGTSPTFIPPDTTNQVTKLAYQIGVQTPISFVPPSTPGDSRNDLIQFAFSEVDGNNQNIPFWAGLNGAGFPNPPNFQSLNENRIDSVNVVVKAGIAAPTGTQTTPTPDSGFVGGYIVTTTQGQTTIISGDISVYPGAPFITETLTQKISEATADARYARIQNVFNTDYFQGFKIVNNSGDPNNDIDFNPGACWDSTGLYPIKLNSTLTKQIDASWVAGNNQGGLFSGSVAASTTYHLFAIINTTSGVVDCGFSTSVTASDIPAGYTAYRRVASLYTDSSSHLVQIINNGDDFILAVPSDDSIQNNQGTSATTVTLSTPSGIVLKANITAHLNLGADMLTVSALITSLAQPDTTPTGTLFTIFLNTAGSTEADNDTYLNIYTNTSSQIRTRQSFASVNTTLYITTVGWADSRGRYG